jgi:hypothetical protein
MNTNVPLEAIPVWGWVAIAVIATAQLALEVYALLDMVRRPPAELTLGGRKWLWAIIILFVNWVGAILYLAVGRKPAIAAESAPAVPAAERSGAAVDALYGGPEDGKDS